MHFFLVHVQEKLRLQLTNYSVFNPWTMEIVQANHVFPFYFGCQGAQSRYSIHLQQFYKTL